MNPTSIAQAAWEYTARTLIDGVPQAPSSREEEIAKAVWEYVTRTLTTYPAWWYAGGGAGGRRKEEPTHLQMLQKEDDRLVLNVVQKFLEAIYNEPRRLH